MGLRIERAEGTPPTVEQVALTTPELPPLEEHPISEEVVQEAARTEATFSSIRLGERKADLSPGSEEAIAIDARLKIVEERFGVDFGDGNLSSRVHSFQVFVAAQEDQLRALEELPLTRAHISAPDWDYGVLTHASLYDLSQVDPHVDPELRFTDEQFLAGLRTQLDRLGLDTSMVGPVEAEFTEEEVIEEVTTGIDVVQEQLRVRNFEGARAAFAEVRAGVETWLDSADQAGAELFDIAMAQGLDDDQKDTLTSAQNAFATGLYRVGLVFDELEASLTSLEGQSLEDETYAETLEGMFDTLRTQYEIEHNLLFTESMVYSRALGKVLGERGVDLLVHEEAPPLS